MIPVEPEVTPAFMSGLAGGHYLTNIYPAAVPNQLIGCVKPAIQISSLKMSAPDCPFSELSKVSLFRTQCSEQNDLSCLDRLPTAFSRRHIGSTSRDQVPIVKSGGDECRADRKPICVKP
jgi:hypothetical protein